MGQHGVGVSDPIELSIKPRWRPARNVDPRRRGEQGSRLTLDGGLKQPFASSVLAFPAFSLTPELSLAHGVWVSGPVKEQVTSQNPDGRANVLNRAARPTLDEQSLVPFLDGKRGVAIVVAWTPRHPFPRAVWTHAVQAINQVFRRHVGPFTGVRLPRAGAHVVWALGDRGLRILSSQRFRSLAKNTLRSVSQDLRQHEGSKRGQVVPDRIYR